MNDRILVLLILFTPLSSISSESPPGSRISDKDRLEFKNIINAGNGVAFVDKIYPDGQLPFPIDEEFIHSAQDHLSNLEIRAESLRSTKHNLGIIKAIIFANMLLCERAAQLTNNVRLVCPEISEVNDLTE